MWLPTKKAEMKPRLLHDQQNVCDNADFPHRLSTVRESRGKYRKLDFNYPCYDHIITDTAVLIWFLFSNNI